MMILDLTVMNITLDLLVGNVVAESSLLELSELRAWIGDVTMLQHPPEVRDLRVTIELSW